MMWKCLIAQTLFLFLVWGAAVATAQEPPTVPDVTGLSIPAAIARLNQVGLAGRANQWQAWDATSALPPDRIAAQSIPAGSAVQPGALVELTVLRAPNATLIYDDNDLTLLNRASAPMDLSTVILATVDGEPGSFSAAQWAESLRPGQCAQVWSVGRNGPKGLDECAAIQTWLVTRSTAQHVWTGRGGTSSFTVSQGGVQRAVCQVAVPGRCDFYLDAAGANGDATSFIHFEYNPDWLIVHNTSTDAWMPLAGFTVFNNAAAQQGAAFPLDDATLYPNRSPVASVGQLAPGQCILFLSGAPALPASNPPDCQVIAQLSVGVEVRFWAAAFDFDSLTDGRRRSCPAADPARITVCIMPR
jgi:hypothetical protein